jgi:hypothetical protein
MKSLVETGAKITYVENLVIKDEVDSRIVSIDNIEASLDQIDILVVSKKLTSPIDFDRIVANVLSRDIWILDPSRLLLDQEFNFLKNPKYLTVGNGF